MSGRKLTLSREHDICEVYQNNSYNTIELGDMYGLSDTHIRNILKKHNVYKKRKILSEEDKKNICYLYTNDQYNCREIGDLLGLNGCTVNIVLHERGVETKNGLFTESQKKEICDLYETGNFTYTDLGKKYNVHSTTISGILNRRGIKNNKTRSQWVRKFSLNEDYFEKIDSEDKAYFLGLLCADGCNVKNSSTVSIGLQSGDRKVLDSFCEYINSNKSLYYIPPKFDTALPQYQMNIVSNKISNDLVNLGCGHHKSYNLKFPNKDQVPSKFIRHFVRGFWDGDGSVMKTRASSVSTKIFLEGLSQILEDHINISSSICKDSHLSDVHRVIYIGGRIQAKKFLDWLYEDCMICLPRKYNRYKQYFY